MSTEPPAPGPEPVARPRVSLGVGDIIATTMGLFLKRLHIVGLLVLPAMLAVTGLFYVFTHELWSSLRDAIGLPRAMAEPIVAYITATVAIGVATGLAAGPLSRAVTAYIAARPIPLGASLAMLRVKPLHTIAVGMLITAGTLALMLLLAVAPSVRMGLLMALVCLAAGMYTLARWGLALPAIPLERLGMRAMRRSEWLSAEYRWPLTGAFFLLFVISVLFGGFAAAGLILLVQVSSREVFGWALDPSREEILLLVDFSFGTMISISLMTIGAAVMRARMIEIKEPPDIQDMVEVFE